MNDIQNLERQLLEAKREKSIKDWQIWHEEGKKFLDSLVGNCYMQRTNVYSFLLFKVNGYKIQKIQSVNHHPGYFVIQTEGHFIVNSSSWSTKIEFPSEGLPNIAPFGTFSLITKNKYNRKETQFDISALKYKEQGLENSSSIERSRVTKIGRYGIDKKTGKESYDVWECCNAAPTQSVASEFIGLFTYKVDETLYNDAKLIADQLKKDVINLWLKHSSTIENAQRVGWTV